MAVAEIEAAVAGVIAGIEPPVGATVCPRRDSLISRSRH